MRIYPLVLGTVAIAAFAGYRLLADHGQESPVDDKKSPVPPPRRNVGNFHTKRRIYHPVLTPDHQITMVPPMERQDDDATPELALKSLKEMKSFLDSRSIRYKPLSDDDDGSLILETPQSPFHEVRYEYNDDGTLLSLDIEIDRNQFRERLDDYLSEEIRPLMFGFLGSQPDRFQVVIHAGDIHMKDWEIWPDNFKPVYEAAIRKAVQPYLSGSAFE